MGATGAYNKASCGLYKDVQAALEKPFFDLRTAVETYSM
jgi:hypothetical protein